MYELSGCSVSYQHLVWQLFCYLLTFYYSYRDIVVIYCHFDFSSAQLLSHVRLSATPWTAAYQASLSITSSQSLFKRMSIELVMPSNHLTLCRPCLFLPSIFPSIRVFSNESTLCMRWPKYWSSATTSVLQNGLVGSPCSPRDSQESSPKASILLWPIFL